MKPRSLAVSDVSVAERTVALTVDGSVSDDTTSILGDVADERPTRPTRDVPDLVVSGVPVLGDVTVRD